MMHLAFYNGREKGRWLDRLIAAHDGGADEGPFSHVELVFDRRPGIYNLCFSSSWRDGGVRFKRIWLDDPARWLLIDVPVSQEKAAIVRQWCLRRLGGRYDVPGVLAFKLPLVRQRLNWWFCSEICTAALQQAGLFDRIRPHRVSPNRLHRMAQMLARKAEHV